MICHIIGARPNFMKCVPLYRELKERGAEQTIIHSGQHYDYRMSGAFIDQLEIVPDINLGIKAEKNRHATIVGKIMIGLEKELHRLRPTDVIVYGDVNTTVAGALAASQMGIRVHHVEAGLRCGDRLMPEEINRIVTDSVSDYNYTPTASAWFDLHRKHENVFQVGNIMIDCIKMFEDKIPQSESQGHVLVTLHRAANVDTLGMRNRIVKNLKKLDNVVFISHPRVQWEGIETIPPQDYLTCLSLQRSARMIITDSGGIQAEAAYFGVPCLVLRDSSEWNFSTLVTPEELDTLPLRLPLPDMWEGKTAERIADIICK